MDFSIKEKKTYPYSIDKIHEAVNGAVQGLEAKITRKDEASGRVEVQFNKTILGKVLGERTFMEINIGAVSSDESNLELLAYPLDALGRKLMFGARKGVTQTVVNWFIAHLEHRLKP